MLRSCALSPLTDIVSAVAPSSLTRYRLVGPCAFVGALTLDLVLKSVSELWLHTPVRLLEWLYLTSHVNTGLALGFVPLSSWTLLWFLHWCVVALMALWLVLKFLRAPCATVALVYGLIGAGFVANVIGRLGSGVIDYVAVGPVLGTGDGALWALFNLADVAVLLGFVLLVAYGLCHALRRR